MPYTREDSLDEVELARRKAKRAERAASMARERALTARWNVEVVVFLFAILIMIVILLFEGVGTEIVAPIAVFGLSMVWYVGHRQGSRLYELYYREELSRLEDYDEIDLLRLQK
ncbi:MAG: hypothetical protein HY673_24155 [Chloroflexi bacterium]|nr:hypothetical protein [Chloroflexota bacterium]